MKAEIRQITKEKRNSMLSSDALDKSTLAQKLFVSSDLYKNSKVLMIYMPLGNETDTKEIMNKAFADTKRVVVPVTDMENVDIIPYTVSPSTVFALGSYSITEPQNALVTDIENIDTVIVPGIAFDLKGGRIGFGKGYYDKFLSRFKGVKIGFCYEYQLVGDTFGETHDVKMDYIITEKAIYKCL